MFSIRLSTVPAEPGTGAWPLADGTREGHEAGLSAAMGLAREDRSPWCPGLWARCSWSLFAGAEGRPQGSGAVNPDSYRGPHGAEGAGLHRC